MKILAQHTKSLRLTLVVVWLACLVGGLLLPRGLAIFDFVERWLEDLRIATLSPRMERRDDVVMLSITEDTLSRHPYRFPIDRNMLAETLEFLNTAGVRAVGLDVLFDQPTEPEKDRRLARIVAEFNAPLVIGWADVEDGMTEKQVEFLSNYLPSATRAYANVVKGDRDGTVRWIFPGREIEGQFRPGFAAALASAAGVETPPARNEVRLLYRRNIDGGLNSIPTFPIHQAKILPKQWFAGKIVIIGADLPTEDRHRTPFAALFGNHRGSIAGTVIHGLALTQLLDGAHLEESGVTPEVVMTGLAAGVGVGIAMLEASFFVEVGLATVSLLILWAAGFGIFVVGGPLVPLFTPSIALATALGLSSIVSSQRFKAEKEHAEAMAQARSDFLAMMSHEVRTPMNGVMGVIELLRESKLDAEQSRMAAIVQDSAASLLSILNDILDFSKIEAGRIDINPEPVSLARLVDGVVATFGTVAEGKGIAVEQSVDDDLPEWIAIDPVRLRQILANLIGNAIKFTEQGQIVLSCRRELDPEGEPLLALHIDDTGIGMSEMVLQRLFQPFTQADGTTTRRFGGTGLGLSISLKLVDLMNGRIDVISEEGKGSKFSVYLPLTEATAPAAGQEIALPELLVKPLATPDFADLAHAETATGPLILVAEDNPTNQWLIRQQLAKLGYRVDIHPDGKAALDAYRPNQHAMIITDYYMPEMDGIDFARAVRKQENGGTHRVPILALTANALPGVVENCQQAGIDDVLTKPTQVGSLAKTIQQWLGPIAGEAVAHGAVPTETESTNGNDSEPVLDTGIFHELFGGINDEVKAALAQYVTGVTELTDTIEQQATDGDGDGLARTAHRLAGESLSAGAVAFGSLCRDLEEAATAANWEQVSSLRPQIKDAFGSVQQAIAAL